MRFLTKRSNLRFWSMVFVNQAIYNVDFVAAREQLLAKDAANVPGAAGDQDLHRVPHGKLLRRRPPTSLAKTGQRL